MLTLDRHYQISPYASLWRLSKEITRCKREIAWAGANGGKIADPVPENGGYTVSMSFDDEQMAVMFRLMFDGV